MDKASRILAKVSYVLTLIGLGLCVAGITLYFCLPDLAPIIMQIVPWKDIYELMGATAAMAVTIFFSFFYVLAFFAASILTGMGLSVLKQAPEDKRAGIFFIIAGAITENPMLVVAGILRLVLIKRGMAKPEVVGETHVE